MASAPPATNTSRSPAAARACSSAASIPSVTNVNVVPPCFVTGSRSEEHTSELQSHSDLHSFPTRRSSDLEHVPVAGGRPSLLECGFDPVGDERERGSALLCDGFTSVVGEDEHRNAERRVVPPPAVRIGVVLPRACSAAEHPPLPITTAPCAASDSFTTSSSAPVSPPSMP